MKKVYFNQFHNKGLIIDTEARTYTLTSCETAQKIATYCKNWGRIEYMKQLIKNAKNSGYVKA